MDKLSAYQTLYTCLETVSRLMAPLAPFYSDALYQSLTRATNEHSLESVHLADFPTYDKNFVDQDLEERMLLAQKISSMVLSLRKKEQVIVRQPLQCIMIPIQNKKQCEQIEKMADLIKSEVNIKEIKFVESIQLEKTIKANFRILGKKYGKLMGAVNREIQSMTQEQINQLDADGHIELKVGEQNIDLLKDEVDIFSQDIPGWSVINDGTLTVALDLKITDELRREGLAREIVKRIQAYRKDHGFDITDHIDIVMQNREDVKDAVEAYKEYICAQVLCDNLEWSDSPAPDQLEFENFKLNVIIRKI